MAEVGEFTREKTRIYVGGLGGAVTEDDLRRTFSPLGQVVAVDVVRTKDRSFAYLDFLPSSDKSLPKLFSTYNGCMWKGGKLRLEKAKEHYLLRLKREWQEESEHATKASESCNAHPSETLDISEKPKKPSSADKPQLNIFFPKLGKVKSLASVGIGKHKYSFQRLQAPSIPTHFCDCEEHSVAFIPTNKKQPSEFENASDGINEQELNIMNSVMNRIFEKANPSKKATGKSESVNGNGVSMNSNDDELADLENDEEDEDNLIINVADGKSDSMDLIGEMKSMMANREPVAKRLVTSVGKPKNVHENREKKRKSPHSVENNGNGSVTPEILTKSQIHLGIQEDRKTEIKSDTKQPESNSLRTLKSTWKDLIGKRGNTPFSISDIIATASQEKDKKLKGDDTPKKSLVSSKKRKKEDDKIEVVSDIFANDLQQKEEPKADEVVLDIFANDLQQKEEEPKADEVVSDVFANDLQRKEEEPKADEVVSDIFANDLQQKEEGPKADDLEKPLTTIADHFMISDVLSNENDDEPEPTTDDIDINVEDIDNLENADKSTDLTEGLPAKNDEDFIRTARGEAWRHKSSWTQLISNAGHTSFSISQIVPNLSFERKADEVDLQPANENLDVCAAETANDQRSVGVVNVKKSSERKASLLRANVESEDSCSFMRSEASLKEWKKAKTSLNSSVNKKKKAVKEST